MTQNVFRMHVLAAGHGDCLWIEYGSSTAPTRILVDAGITGTFRPLKAALQAVKGTDPSHELLVVTHIDADHIAGALPLLEDGALASQFKEIWFNGRKHLVQAQNLQPFGAVQGERLTSALSALGGRWNASFGQGPVVVPASGPLSTVPIGPGVVTILSPGASQLAKLLAPWDREVKAAGLLPAVAAPKPKAAPSGWQAFGGLDVASLASQRVAADTAPANGSSIAMLIEFAGKRLLLGADAHPDVLLAAIKRLSPQGRLKVDAWKMPHHGSAANVTDEILEAVDAKTFVFSSNGAYFRHPDKVAVAKVLRRYKAQGVELVFNYRTQYNAPWDSDALRGAWGYSTTYGVAQQGVTVQLL